MGGKTFSDHWHRVANLRLALRPTLDIQRQLFRGEVWYVVRDPMNDSYFRLQPEAYSFAARLGPGRTVEQVWDELLESEPETALGQEDVIQLLTQLNSHNLLYSRGNTDTSRIFDRLERKRKEKIKSKIVNFMYAQFPLVDPDRFLNAMLPVIRLLAGPFGWVLWLGTFAYGVRCVFERLPELLIQTEGVLAPHNWWSLYLGMLIIKTLHELGHAGICKYYGGEVHTLGVTMMIFTPMPYCDATSSWGFRSRWHRALVGGGGMIVEFFVGAVAAIVWSQTAPGLIHSVSYNMMWIATVTSIFFNINPLVRFDGYYILSDVLDIPNLATRAQQELSHAVEKYLLGNTESKSQADTTVEAVLLFVYAVAAGLYRVMMSGSILLYIGSKYLLLGVVIGVVCAVQWIAVPAFSAVRYLLTSPSLGRSRFRAIAVSAVLAGGGLGLLGAVPAPRRFRAPGVVEAIRLSKVNTESAGTMIRVFSAGEKVKQGAPLAELKNPELDLDLELAQRQLDEIAAIEQKATVQSLADLEPLRQRRRAIASMIDNLKEQKTSLVVRARQDGVWVVPRGTALTGAWIHRGDTLGTLVDPSQVRFTAVVSQEEASELFEEQISNVELRLFAQEPVPLTVTSHKIIPFQQRDLPSAALGFRGGGDIAVADKDNSGVKATEGFFEIEATLAPAPGVSLLHGRSGQLRLTLRPEPILFQVARKLRQLVQRRYHL